MKKFLVPLVLLFLFCVNTAAAVAPSLPRPITTFTPVVLDVGVPRAQPKMLKPVPIVVYTETVEGSKVYAFDLLGRTQFDCLDKLFTKESHWNPSALNKSSGAYGIPQALPGSKMESSGSDWRTNPLTQVRWGIKYVDRRYGSACGAWRHSQINGWY